jgi:hypothetical protein
MSVVAATSGDGDDRRDADHETLARGTHNASEDASTSGKRAYVEREAQAQRGTTAEVPRRWDAKNG